MSTIHDLKVGYSEEGGAPELADRVGAFEALIGEALPDDYREFLFSLGKTILLEGNTVGGDVSDPYLVDVLYGVNDARRTLMSAHKNYVDRLPKGVISIGTSAGDDQICLALKSAKRQGVFYWDHEGEVDAHQNRTPDYSNMGLMAGSFTEMLSKMEGVPDNPKPKSRAVRVDLKF